MPKYSKTEELLHNLINPLVFLKAEERLNKFIKDPKQKPDKWMKNWIKDNWDSYSMNRISKIIA